MSAYARAASGAVVGVDAQSVVVECHRSKGLPGKTLIGMARGAAKESLVRAQSAIAAAGISLTGLRLLANLLPAELPKEASALDLPLALSLLAAGGTLPCPALAGRRFFGELSLSGALEPVRGAVLVADLARRAGDEQVIVPRCNAAEAAVIPGVEVIGADTLTDVIEHVRGQATIAPSTAPQPAPIRGDHGCLSDVSGQQWAKRGLEIVAAGDHNLLMIGPPGSGKTMLARRLAGLLPPLTAEESIEVTRVQSAAGLLDGQGLARQRPFRAPHHTASEAALCGGGSLPRPGEVTLAHRGVLFLDELPEFSRRALESLREPLEEGVIRIARAAMSLSFPASVLLVAAMNPCPCGRFRGDMPKAQRDSSKPKGPVCMCTYDQIQRYRSRISGPLLDRIDIHIIVDAVPYREFALRGSGQSSDTIRGRVHEARARQHHRLGHHRTNATMSHAELREHVAVGEPAMQLIEQAIDSHGLSSRAISRALKVARTIADLSGEDCVSKSHIEEALRLRLLDGATSGVGAVQTPPH